jgi:hypothetical protein
LPYETNPLPNGGGIILTSTDGYNWVVRKQAMVDPTTAAPVIPYGTAYGAGAWVAVGSKGTILRSVDSGVTWTMVVQGVSDDDELHGVTYGKGESASGSQFVAVGKYGKILTSPDGNTWTLQVSATNSFLNGIVIGKGVFVAAGTVVTDPSLDPMYSIIASTDGQNWSAYYGSLERSEELLGVTYGQDLNGKYHFVAVGYNSGSLTVVSDDGYSWSPVTSGANSTISGVASGNGNFVAVQTNGVVLTAPGNSTRAGGDPTLPGWSLWSSQLPFASNSNVLNGITFFKDIFIAVGGDAKLITSPDGKSWTERASVASNFLYGVAYGGGSYAAVGWGGQILTSTDKIKWVEQSSGISGSLFGIAYGKKMFVAVGSGGKVATSVNGSSWTVYSSPVGSALFAVAYGNNTFVAVGEGGRIVTSTDGVHWSLRTSGVSDHLFGVSYANQRFVAVGQNGRVLSSSTGTAWTNNTPSYSSYRAECLYGVTYGGAAFVVVGDNGRVLTSPDLSAWTQRQIPSANELRAVAYAGNEFVAFGSAGTFLTCAAQDGSNWTVEQPPISYTLMGFAYDGGSNLVVVGAYASIISSLDNVYPPWTSWTVRSSGTYNTLTSVAFGDNTYVAVGENGVVLTSKNGVTWDVKTLPPPPQSYLNELGAVAYGNGRFVAGGNCASHGCMYTSKDDGATWVVSFPKAYFSSTNICSITYGNGRFVAGGMNGIVLVSYYDGSPAGDWWGELYLEAVYSTYGVAYGDFTTQSGAHEPTFVLVGAPNRTFLTSEAPESWWMIRWAPFFPQDQSLGFSGIAYGAGIFTVVGPVVKIGISKDGGATWKQVPLSGFKNSFNFTGITFGGNAAGANNTFAAVGSYGEILTSTDAENWTFHNSGVTVSFTGIVYGNANTGHSYICVGNNGTIFQSGLLP